MEKNIYIETLLRKRIIVKPEFLNKNLDKNIENILKNQVGNKCITEGYVKEDTISIKKKSIPKVLTSNFTCDLAVDIIYSAEVCNPANGNIIPCKITHINKLGLMASNGPLLIIIGKQYHNNKEIFKNLKVDDEVDVLVINKRYTLNGNVIEIVGKLTTDKEPNKKKKLKQKEIKEENKMTELDELEEMPDSDLEEEAEEKEALESEKEDISDIDEDIIAGESEDEDEDLLERSIDEEEYEESEDEEYV